MNPSNFLKNNKLIYTSLVVGMVLFTAITYFATKEDQYFMIPDLTEPLFIATPAVMIAAITSGNFLYAKLILPANEGKTLQQKVAISFTATIIRLALLEGSVLLAIASMLTTTNTFYLIFVGIGLLYYFTLAPKNEKISRDLNLTSDEKHALGMSH